MKNFSDLGKKTQDNERELRCMIYELNGDVHVEYKNFDYVRERVECPIEIYKPNVEQKQYILKVMAGDMEISEDEMKAKVNDEVFLLELLSMLTNIYLDLNKEKEEDIQIIKNILSEPTDILIRVKIEINKICNQIFNLMYESYKMTSMIPEDIRKVIQILDSKDGIEEIKEDGLNG